MGKAKKRSIALGRYNQITNLSREEAISDVVQKINNGETPDDIISLFGLSAEELLEAGANFEAIKALGRLF